MSSAAAPNSIATAASAIMLPLRPHDVDAQDAVRLGFRQDLHKALGLQVDLGAPIGSEWKLPGIVGNAGALSSSSDFPTEAISG